MDHQHREGGKTGSGGILSEGETNFARRERLRKLAMEVTDLASDPYLLKNHYGTYECRLCLTLHTNEGSYLAHTQARRHQTNLSKRAHKEAKDKERAALAAGVPFTGPAPQSVIDAAAAAATKKKHKPAGPRIGRPGYNVVKIREPAIPGIEDSNRKYGLLFHVHLPMIKAKAIPVHQIMSSFAQTIDPPNKLYQYLQVSAEPYEIIAFKIPNKPLAIDEETGDSRIFAHWDQDSGVYTVQLIYEDVFST